MKNLKNGSILLFSLTFLTITTLLSFIAFQNISYFYETALNKQKYKQKLIFAESVFNYAISICKLNFNKIIKDKKIVNINLQDVSVNSENFTPNIKISPCSDKELSVESKVHCKAANIFITIESLLEKKSEKTFCIKNWKICEL